MNEEALNMSIRKFLKEVGVSSQREIEKAVRAAASAGALPCTDGLEVSMVLTVDGIDLTHEVRGRIEIA